MNSVISRNWVRGFCCRKVDIIEDDSNENCRTIYFWFLSYHNVSVLKATSYWYFCSNLKNWIRYRILWLKSILGINNIARAKPVEIINNAHFQLHDPSLIWYTYTYFKVFKLFEFIHNKNRYFESVFWFLTVP